MRYLTIFLLSFLIFGCGPTSSPDAPESIDQDIIEQPEPESEKTDKDTTPHGQESPEMEESGANDPMTSIRKEYARIEAALAAGTLRKDSISYYCDDAMADGQIELYSDASGVVLAVNGYSQGDHYGTTEHYYFRDGQPVFLFQETGTWQFGGEMRIMDDGMEVPGTIDNITEDRLYFHEGSTIKALTKEYEIKNGEDVDPSTIPNETMAHNGELPDGLGFIQSAIANKKIDCKLME